MIQRNTKQIAGVGPGWRGGWEAKHECTMLTCWYSDNEGFGVWPRASPVCGPDFEQIAFPRLQTVHEGRSRVSREGEGLCSKRFESRGVTLNQLREERQALNMRMLLAIQLRDAEAQEALCRELEKNDAEIQRFLSRT